MIQKPIHVLAPYDNFEHGKHSVTIRVTDASGQPHDACVLVADTETKREHGLMDVDSLGGYDGMLFRFPSPISASFYMYRTRLPLSIGFFGADGSFVSAADMAPFVAMVRQELPATGDRSADAAPRFSGC